MNGKNSYITIPQPTQKEETVSVAETCQEGQREGRAVPVKGPVPSQNRWDATSGSSERHFKEKTVVFVCCLLLLM